MGCSASSVEAEALPENDTSSDGTASMKLDIKQRNLYQLSEAVESSKNGSVASKEAEETLSAHSYPLSNVENVPKSSRPNSSHSKKSNRSTSSRKSSAKSNGFSNSRDANTEAQQLLQNDAELISENLDNKNIESLKSNESFTVSAPEQNSNFKEEPKINEPTVDGFVGFGLPTVDPPPKLNEPTEDRFVGFGLPAVDPPPNFPIENLPSEQKEENLTVEVEAPETPSANEPVKETVPDDNINIESSSATVNQDNKEEQKNLSTSDHLNSPTNTIPESTNNDDATVKDEISENSKPNELVNINFPDDSVENKNSPPDANVSHLDIPRSPDNNKQIDFAGSFNENNESRDTNAAEPKEITFLNNEDPKDLNAHHQNLLPLTNGSAELSHRAKKYSVITLDDLLYSDTDSSDGVAPCSLAASSSGLILPRPPTSKRSKQSAGKSRFQYSPQPQESLSVNSSNPASETLTEMQPDHLEPNLEDSKDSIALNILQSHCTEEVNDTQTTEEKSEHRSTIEDEQASILTDNIENRNNKSSIENEEIGFESQPVKILEIEEKSSAPAADISLHDSHKLVDKYIEGIEEKDNTETLPLISNAFSSEKENEEELQNESNKIETEEVSSIKNETNQIPETASVSFLNVIDLPLNSEEVLVADDETKLDSKLGFNNQEEENSQSSALDDNNSAKNFEFTTTENTTLCPDKENDLLPTDAEAYQSENHEKEHFLLEDINEVCNENQNIEKAEVTTSRKSSVESFSNKLLSENEAVLSQVELNERPKTELKPAYQETCDELIADNVQTNEISESKERVNQQLESKDEETTSIIDQNADGTTIRMKSPELRLELDLEHTSEKDILNAGEVITNDTTSTTELPFEDVKKEYSIDGDNASPLINPILHINECPEALEHGNLCTAECFSNADSIEPQHQEKEQTEFENTDKIQAITEETYDNIGAESVKSSRPASVARDLTEITSLNGVEIKHVKSLISKPSSNSLDRDHSGRESAHRVLMGF